jgi:hypothetical protein
MGPPKYYLFLEDDMQWCHKGLSHFHYLLQKADAYRYGGGSVNIENNIEYNTRILGTQYWCDPQNYNTNPKYPKPDIVLQ